MRNCISVISCCAGECLRRRGGQGRRCGRSAWTTWTQSQAAALQTARQQPEDQLISGCFESQSALLSRCAGLAKSPAAMLCTGIGVGHAMHAGLTATIRAPSQTLRCGHRSDHTTVLQCAACAAAAAQRCSHGGAADIWLMQPICMDRTELLQASACSCCLACLQQISSFPGPGGMGLSRCCAVADAAPG